MICIKKEKKKRKKYDIKIYIVELGQLSLYHSNKKRKFSTLQKTLPIKENISTYFGNSNFSPFNTLQ